MLVLLREMLDSFELTPKVALNSLVLYIQQCIFFCLGLSNLEAPSCQP